MREIVAAKVCQRINFLKHSRFAENNLTVADKGRKVGGESNPEKIKQNLGYSKLNI